MTLILALIFYTFVIEMTFASKTEWGILVGDQSKRVRLGARFQGILSHDNTKGVQDFYLRRTRLNFEFKHKNSTFFFDLRNDNANQGDGGERSFNVGDGYWKIDLQQYGINNIKLFRSKVDVSYSQTSSSKHLLNPDRTTIAEHASTFIVHNRRAVNAQINGNYKNLHYHIVASDGVQSSSLVDSKGNQVSGLDGQKLTLGAKVRYFFIGDARKNKVQDTFYGLRESFSVGIGHFVNNKINVLNSLGVVKSFSMNRALTNVELSIAMSRLRFLAESFIFRDDIVGDLMNASNKEDILGSSRGYYAQMEYFITEKIAPYITLEEFNQNTSLDDATLVASTLGLNFYQQVQMQRFGLAYQKSESGNDFGGQQNESIKVYFMLDF